MSLVQAGQLNLVKGKNNPSEISNLSAKLLKQAKDIEKNSSEIGRLSSEVSNLTSSCEENSKALVEHGQSILDILASIQSINISIENCTKTTSSAVASLKTASAKNLIMTLALFSSLFPDTDMANAELLNHISKLYAKVYNESLNISEIKKFLVQNDGKQLK